MAGTALWSFKLDRDGEIRVAHVFFGKDEAEARANLKAHADICPKFGPAVKNKETVEIPVDVDDLPEGDQEALEEWLDELLDLEVEEDDDDDLSIDEGDDDEEDDEEK